MKERRIILSTVLLVLALGILTPQFAQEPSTGSEKTDQQKLQQTLGMGLVRTINTAEVTDRIQYGSYAPWPNLLAHQQEKFNHWRATYFPEEMFAGMPEILPGYSLRLNVHADGQGYDLRLQDAKSKKWAVFSDESGVIWVGEPLQ